MDSVKARGPQPWDHSFLCGLENDMKVGALRSVLQRALRLTSRSYPWPLLPLHLVNYPLHMVSSTNPLHCIHLSVLSLNE